MKVGTRPLFCWPLLSLVSSIFSRHLVFNIQYLLRNWIILLLHYFLFLSKCYIATYDILQIVLKLGGHVTKYRQKCTVEVSFSLSLSIYIHIQKTFWFQPLFCWACAPSQWLAVFRLVFIASSWPDFLLKLRPWSFHLDTLAMENSCCRVTELVLEEEEHLWAQAVRRPSEP